MEVAERQKFSKNEHVCSKKDIEKLFSDGSSFLVYPLKVIYLPVSDGIAADSCMAVLISVPKKRIKRAVHRNRVKRLIREAFRLHKNEWAPSFLQKRLSLHIALMYISNEIVAYTDVEKALLKAFKIIDRTTDV